MQSALGIAVIGTGFMGTAHARAAWLAGGRLVGVSASTSERASEAAIRLHADRGFPSAAALLEDVDVDVVHLCVPNHLHVPLAKASLARGKHVVCEKPLSLDVPSANDLVSELAAAGTVGAVPFVYRYYPVVRELRERIATNELGRVHLVHGTYLQDWLSSPSDTNWRVDRRSGGPSRVFADIGSHWFDLVEFLLADRVARISARFSTVFQARPNEDIAVAQFETVHGAIGSVVLSQVSPGRKNALTVEMSGTLGTARFDQEQPESCWLGRRDGASIVTCDPPFLTKEAARHVVAPAGHTHGYLDCVDRFVADTYDAISGSIPEGLPTFAEGRRAVCIADAALRSARAGGHWLEIKP